MIKRVIYCFDKKSEKLIKEIELKDISLTILQEIFGINSNNPMFDCYQITFENRKCFEKHINETLDLSKYNYYVEAYEI